MPTADSPTSLRELRDRLSRIRALVRIELAAAAIVALWIAVPQNSDLNRPALAAIVAVALLKAAAVATRRLPVSDGSITAMSTFGAGLIGAGIYLSGGAASPGVLLYLWLVAFAAWYLPPAFIAVQVGAVMVSYGAAVTFYQDHKPSLIGPLSGTEFSHWVLLSAVAVGFAVMVRSFRRTLLDREQRFEIGFDRSSTPMAIADLDHRLAEVNAAYCDLLGRAESELLGASTMELTHPDDRNRIAQSLAESATDAASAQTEMRMLRGDGSAVSVLTRSTVITDRRGRPLYVFAQALDITAIRAAHEQLRRRAERERALADLGRMALEGMEPNSLSEAIVDVAATYLDAEFVAVLAAGVEPGTTRIIAAGNSDEITAPGAVINGQRSLAAWTLEQNAPVRVEDWDQETRVTRGHLERGSMLRSAISAPIRRYEQASGVLIAESVRVRAFSDEDITYLRAMSNLLATSLDAWSAREQRDHAAQHDLLTGLPNRLLLTDMLRDRLNRPRIGTQIGVILLDLDHLGLVNDSLGHAAGDQILRELAARLTTVIARPNTVARLAADEFAIVLDQIRDEHAAITILNQALAAVATPITLAEEVMITATAGLVLSDGSHTAETLLRDAEATMHRAKETARGRFEVFQGRFHGQRLARLRTENALRRAVANDELRVVYQPIVELASGRTTAAEALLRWTHPEWGPISPAEFIPIAEETGLILQIGEQVIAACCRQLRCWLSEGTDPLALHLNVSARQVYDSPLVNQLSKQLQLADVPGSLITVELTETAVIADRSAALETLQQLTELGVRIALDDYGTGQASLGYLNSFPFDVIKLDRMLIRDIAHSHKDDIIATSSIEMSHALGLTVIGEGIETSVQHQLLSTIGCDYGQGYLYGHPGPASELISTPLASPPPPPRRRTKSKQRNAQSTARQERRRPRKAA